MTYQTTPPERLSYQKLLEWTQLLPPEGQEYVMRFLSNNDQKTRQRLMDADREKREYETRRRRLQDNAGRLEALRLKYEECRRELAEAREINGPLRAALRRLCNVLENNSGERNFSATSQVALELLDRKIKQLQGLRGPEGGPPAPATESNTPVGGNGASLP